MINNVSIRRDFDGDLTQLDGFADGSWWVQDAAAPLLRRCLAKLPGMSLICVRTRW